MMPQGLSPDAQVILLLCSSLGLPRGKTRVVKPLSQQEWNQLARRIAESDVRRPGVLLELGPDSLREALRLSDALADRLRRLLERGGQIAIELERLSSLGIRVLTRADDFYPGRLKQILRGQAPSILFVAGDTNLLSAKGLAIVGSRHVDETGAAFAKAVGQKCADAGLTVISGAARGVDRQGMAGALGSGGMAVGVLADSLEKSIASRETRRLVVEGRLTLVTPYHPQARFTVGAAMQRNKLIYGLARYALVVASDKVNGGTWAGAIENLKAGWVPLFVRTGPNVPAGNLDLLARGGLEFADALLVSGKDLKEWFEEHAELVGLRQAKQGVQGNLFADKEIIESHKEHVKESLRFFSNEMKPERELWVCREFLENLGISVTEGDLVSVEQDPPDVLFENGRFEIKEILDRHRRRSAEYQKALKRAEEATYATELLEPYTPKTMSASDVKDIVAAEGAKLLRKYGPSTRSSLDLLFYVNLSDYAVTGEAVEPVTYLPSDWKWRSLSFVSNNCSCVIWVSDFAPDFLKKNLGRVLHKNPTRL